MRSIFDFTLASMLHFQILVSTLTRVFEPSAIHRDLWIKIWNYTNSIKDNAYITINRYVEPS